MPGTDFIIQNNGSLAHLKCSQDEDGNSHREVNIIQGFTVPAKHFRELEEVSRSTEGNLNQVEDEERQATFLVRVDELPLSELCGRLVT